MDKYPVLAGGETVGELTVEAAASDTVLDMSCVRREGLWCAWAVGESGALRIGIPEPEGDRLHLRRRFSRSLTAPIGRILRTRQHLRYEASVFCGRFKRGREF